MRCGSPSRCATSCSRVATSARSTSARAPARWLLRLRRSCARSSASTRVPELLELARARSLPNTEFVEGDGTALPFPDASFDLAGTHRTLHHVAQPERVVAELARVTRPGGHVLVVDQLAPDDPAAAAALHEFETARDPSHTRLLADA